MNIYFSLETKFQQSSGYIEVISSNIFVKHSAPIFSPTLSNGSEGLSEAAATAMMKMRSTAQGATHVAYIKVQSIFLT